MARELKVREFYSKQKVLDFVNTKSAGIDIVTITSSQEFFFYKHFLWYYDK